MLSAGATWNVGALEFGAGGVEIVWGATQITTGVCLWSAPSLTFAGGNVNVGGFLTTMNAATLTINNSVATNINSPLTVINSVTTRFAAGRTLQVDNIAPTTANSLALSGVNDINGRTDVGMTITQVQSIAGNGSGMDLTNIANFDNYSASNVLLPCKQFTANIPSFTLTAGVGYTLVYTSPTKIWSWLNIPALLFSYSFRSQIFSAGSPAGQATSVGIYIVLANLTTPGNNIVFSTVTGRSVPNNSSDSLVLITDNQSYPNDQSQIAQGNSYVIRVLASPLDSPNNSTLVGTTLSFNVHNAVGL
jgi:hypothetical protein